MSTCLCTLMSWLHAHTHTGRSCCRSQRARRHQPSHLATCCGSLAAAATAAAAATTATGHRHQLDLLAGGCGLNSLKLTHNTLPAGLLLTALSTSCLCCCRWCTTNTTTDAAMSSWQQQQQQHQMGSAGVAVLLAASTAANLPQVRCGCLNKRLH